jgi:hypothetical protein
MLASQCVEFICHPLVMLLRPANAETEIRPLGPARAAVLIIVPVDSDEMPAEPDAHPSFFPLRP